MKKTVTLYFIFILLFNCSKDETTAPPPEYREIKQICVVNEHGALILSLKLRGIGVTPDLCEGLFHQIADVIELKRDRTHVKYYLEGRTTEMEYEIKETDQIGIMP